MKYIQKFTFAIKSSYNFKIDSDPAWAERLHQVTFRGPFQPQLFHSYEIWITKTKYELFQCFL